MYACGCGASLKLTALFREPDHARLARLAVGAAGAYVDARQALGRARRAELLLGDGAGLRDQQLAEALGETSIRQFGQLQTGLREVVEGLDQAGRAGLEASLADLAPAQAAAARRHAVLTLIDSGASAAVAGAALERLEAGLGRVAELTTVDQGLAYLDERLGRLAEEREPLRAVEDEELGLCVLILLLSSIYVLLVVVAVIVCSLAGCDPGALLDEMIRDACTDRD
jgi:hypothetical protein